MQFLARNHKKNVGGLGLDEESFDLTAKGCSTEETDSILNLGSEKPPVKRMKRQAAEGEKIFSNNISDNATISRKQRTVKTQEQEQQLN